VHEKNPKLTKVDTDLVQLYTLDDCLSPRECDDIVAVIDQHLRPSTLTTIEKDASFRTSRTCDLSLLRNPTVAAIDERIARTLGVRLAYAEGMQAQRYDIGQQFKAHTDYFEPNTPEYAVHGSNRGNRTWTFMVYLNEGMMGGGTKFLAINKTFLPKKGRAVIWNNLYEDGTPNPDTLHSGEPVIMGHKIIVTQWFREKGAGPMFY
jgi:prolyl 4-hydroxylase